MSIPSLGYNLFFPYLCVFLYFFLNKCIYLFYLPATVFLPLFLPVPLSSGYNFLHIVCNNLNMSESLPRRKEKKISPHRALSKSFWKGGWECLHLYFVCPDQSVLRGWRLMLCVLGSCQQPPTSDCKVQSSALHCDGQTISDTLLCFLWGRGAGRITLCEICWSRLVVLRLQCVLESLRGGGIGTLKRNCHCCSEILFSLWKPRVFFSSKFLG